MKCICGNELMTGDISGLCQKCTNAPSIMTEVTPEQHRDILAEMITELTKRVAQLEDEELIDRVGMLEHRLDKDPLKERHAYPSLGELADQVAELNRHTHSRHDALYNSNPLPNVVIKKTPPTPDEPQEGHWECERCNDIIPSNEVVGLGDDDAYHHDGIGDDGQPYTHYIKWIPTPKPDTEDHWECATCKRSFPSEYVPYGQEANCPECSTTLAWIRKPDAKGQCGYDNGGECTCKEPDTDAAREVRKQAAIKSAEALYGMGIRTYVSLLIKDIERI